jgi:uncharacterized protein (TIGR02284 family)
MSARTELDILNHLLETCRDGERGYRFAAEHARDPGVKGLFTALADERSRFADELTPHVHRLGGQATTEGTASGVIHRGWMSLKGSLARAHDEALLAEAERGERAAISAYRDALFGMLPPTVVDVVERHLVAIQTAAARITAFDVPRPAGA